MGDRGKSLSSCFGYRPCSDSTFVCPWYLSLAVYPNETMGITTLFLQLRTRLLLNTHVQVGTPRMDWVAFPVLNRVSNPIYCFLSHLTIMNNKEKRWPPLKRVRDSKGRAKEYSSAKRDIFFDQYGYSESKIIALQIIFTLLKKGS